MGYIILSTNSWADSTVGYSDRIHIANANIYGISPKSIILCMYEISFENEKMER